MQLLKLEEARFPDDTQFHNPLHLSENDVEFFAYDASLRLAIYLPSHEAFYSEMVSRNYPFLSHEEQAVIRKARIGIVGQGTVGGNLAIAMSRYGFEHFRTCDHDIFDLGNLNRQPSNLFGLGQNKAEAVALEMLRINPFVDVEVFPPLDSGNFSHFVNGCDIVVSALDDAKLILRLNQAAIQQKIPVLLGTDLGSRVLLDVFAYHQDAPFMNGRLSLDEMDLPYLVLVAKIIGVDYMPVEMLEAILMRIEGKINYFAQTTVSANVCSSMLIEAALFVLLQRPVLAHSHVDIIDTIAQPPYIAGRQEAWQKARDKLNEIVEKAQAGLA